MPSKVHTPSAAPENIDVTTDDILKILRTSLYEPYSISQGKFDIDKLIKIERRINALLI